MSDIFVSYDDVDRERVRRLVQAFESRGWSVWWDHHLQTGEAFGRVIERELAAASAVVVAWSETSIQSDWVRAEADEGWKRHRLFPVTLDAVSPPMPYGQIQTADLVGWDEDDTHPGLLQITSALTPRIEEERRAVRGTKRTAAALPSRPAMGSGPFPWNTAGAAAATVVALIVVAALAWQFRPRSAAPESIPPVAPVTRDRPEGGDPPGPAVEETRAGGPASRGRPRPVAGHWRAMVTYPDGATFEERFTFEVSGRQVSGTASMRGYGNRREILDGAIDGGRLSFRITGRVQVDLFGDRNVTYRYEATPTPDGLRFRLRDEASGDPAISFTANRISAAEAARVATGGTRPRLGGMEAGNLYGVDHVRKVFASAEGALRVCYEGAEFDPVDHQFVTVDLTLGPAGRVQAFELRPPGTSLDSCVRGALTRVEWGPTDSGRPGRLRLNLTARLPWNP